jgi:hypothetical protein
MTATQHGPPSNPYGPAAGAVSGSPAVPPAGPPGYDPRPAPPAPRRHTGLLTAGVVVAILLSTAALVVGIINLTGPTPAPAAAAPTSTSPSTSSTGDTTAADRALCTAIGPLMAENNKFTNAWADLGESGTPAKDAALPKFISDTQDWISRAQPILDQNPDASAFFRRSFQRFIDDQHLLAVGIAPGPFPAYATALWVDSIGAYGGPLRVCYQLGIRW